MDPTQLSGQEAGQPKPKPEGLCWPQPPPRPRRPLPPTHPSAPRFRLLGAGRRGERERPSPLSLPAPEGRDCTSNLQHTPQRSGFPDALPPSQPSQPSQPQYTEPTHPSPAVDCPPPRLDFPGSRLGSVPAPQVTSRLLSLLRGSQGRAHKDPVPPSFPD